RPIRPGRPEGGGRSMMVCPYGWEGHPDTARRAPAVSCDDYWLNSGTTRRRVRSADPQPFLKGPTKVGGKLCRDTNGAGTANGARDEVPSRELRAVLDAELDRLHEKWRFPLIICYLEGHT